MKRQLNILLSTLLSLREQHSLINLILYGLLFIFVILFTYYVNLEYYFLKLFIIFLIFHFIFNKFTYSEYVPIRLLQKFILCSTCVYFSVYLFVYFDFIGSIFCNTTDKDSATNDLFYKIAKQGLEYAYQLLREGASSLSVLQKILEEMKKSSNNFLSDFYEYLDSLTFLQESALLHVLLFSILIISVFNILSVLFGNEIIKYFNIEERFPWLGLFFRLRIKFQRYYLIWNVFLLLFVCVLGIYVNLLLYSIK